MKIDPKAVGRRIRERREDLGIGQKTLAKELKDFRGYSQQNLASLEKGLIKDPRRQAMDLADPLQTTADWLLYAKGPKSTAPRILTPAEYAELPVDIRLEITNLVAKHNLPAKSA